MMMNNRKEKECGLLVFSGRFPQLPLREQNIGTGDEDDDDCDDDTRILRSWRWYMIITMVIIMMIKKLVTIL